MIRRALITMPKEKSASSALLSAAAISVCCLLMTTSLLPSFVTAASIGTVPALQEKTDIGGAFDQPTDFRPSIESPDHAIDLEWAFDSDGESAYDQAAAAALSPSPHQQDDDLTDGDYRHDVPAPGGGLSTFASFFRLPWKARSTTTTTTVAASPRPPRPTRPQIVIPDSRQTTANTAPVGSDETASDAISGSISDADDLDSLFGDSPDQREEEGASDAEQPRDAASSHTSVSSVSLGKRRPSSLESPASPEKVKRFRLSSPAFDSTERPLLRMPSEGVSPNAISSPAPSDAASSVTLCSSKDAASDILQARSPLPYVGASSSAQSSVDAHSPSGSDWTASPLVVVPDADFVGFPTAQDFDDWANEMEAQWAAERGSPLYTPEAAAVASPPSPLSGPSSPLSVASSELPRSPEQVASPRSLRGEPIWDGFSDNFSDHLDSFNEEGERTPTGLESQGHYVLARSPASPSSVSGASSFRSSSASPSRHADVNADVNANADAEADADVDAEAHADADANADADDDAAVKLTSTANELSHDEIAEALLTMYASTMPESKTTQEDYTSSSSDADDDDAEDADDVRSNAHGESGQENTSDNESNEDHARSEADANGSDSDVKSDSESNSKSESESDSDSEDDAESVAESKSESESGLDSEAESTKSNSKSESSSASASESESESSSASESESGSDSENESESVVSRQSDRGNSETNFEQNESGSEDQSDRESDDERSEVDPEDDHMMEDVSMRSFSPARSVASVNHSVQHPATTQKRKTPSTHNETDPEDNMRDDSDDEEEEDREDDEDGVPNAWTSPASSEIDDALYAFHGDGPRTAVSGTYDGHGTPSTQQEENDHPHYRRDSYQDGADDNDEDDDGAEEQQSDVDDQRRPRHTRWTSPEPEEDSYNKFEAALMERTMQVIANARRRAQLSLPVDRFDQAESATHVSGAVESQSDDDVPNHYLF